MNNIVYKPIGIVHSPLKTPDGTPIQLFAADRSQATIEVLPEYAEGLKELNGFSHIYVLFHLHLAICKSSIVVPFLDTEQRGNFSTLAPGRSNPIGISVACLGKITDNILHVKNMDMLVGSPVLDIKPYIPQFDVFEKYKNGWLEMVNHKIEEVIDDGRFINSHL
jgi:tRNA-Thr(GGU) m(6)t(6)A37 methyltransferase TsaA